MCCVCLRLGKIFGDHATIVRLKAKRNLPQTTISFGCVKNSYCLVFVFNFAIKDLQILVIIVMTWYLPCFWRNDRLSLKALQLLLIPRISDHLSTREKLEQATKPQPICGQRHKWQEWRGGVQREWDMCHWFAMFEQQARLVWTRSVIGLNSIYNLFEQHLQLQLKLHFNWPILGWPILPVYLFDIAWQGFMHNVNTIIDLFVQYMCLLSMTATLGTDATKKI